MSKTKTSALDHLDGAACILTPKQSNKNHYKRMREAADGLWIVVQRVDEGSWEKQTEVWKAAAEHARDFYKAVKEELMKSAEREIRKKQ